MFFVGHTRIVHGGSLVNKENRLSEEFEAISCENNKSLKMASE